MQLPNDSVHALLKRAGMPASNENSYTTPDALIRDIELSRSRGYAVDEGEQEIGVRCFAVPVPDAPTLTAISISGPAARLTLKSATKVTPLLKRVARDIASEFDREAAGLVEESSAAAVGASASVSARSLNSTTLSISVPIAMLVIPLQEDLDHHGHLVLVGELLRSRQRRADVLRLDHLNRLAAEAFGDAQVIARRIPSGRRRPRSPGR